MNKTARKAQDLIRHAVAHAEYSKDIRKTGRAYMIERADATAAEAIVAIRQAQELLNDMIADIEAK